MTPTVLTVQELVSDRPLSMVSAAKRKREKIALCHGMTLYKQIRDQHSQHPFTCLTVALETRGGSESAMLELTTNNEDYWFVNGWIRENLEDKWVAVDSWPCEF